MASIPATQTVDGKTIQYIRKCTLLVADNQGRALDLSSLRIKFSVKRANAQTPNAADIRVYNVEAQTAISLRKDFSRVILQAGYEGNFGVIFQGTIKQVIIGRESATDTFVEIIASDGDLAYNFAVVKSTIAAGASQEDQVKVCADAMAKLGVTTGGNSTINSSVKLPRGKVMFGNARDYLRDVAQSTQNSWSIQDEKLVFIPKNAYLPGQAVILNTETGMIGTPQQTLQGVNVKCLLNPNIQIGTRVQLNNDAIARLAINLAVPGTAASIPAALTTDGVYFVLVAEHIGDTRGIEWYSNLVTLFIDPTLPITKGVEVNYDY